MSAKEDWVDLQRWRDQTSPDPRVTDPRHRKRLALYEDDDPTLAERGADLDEFLEPSK